MNRIAEHLVNQFDRSWAMLVQAIEKVPNEKWPECIESIDIPWSETEGMNVWYFSNTVFHTIETVDFYTRDTPNDFKWGYKIEGIDWKSESPSLTTSRITKKDMLEYLTETKDNLNKKLSSFSEDEFFEQDGFRKWQASRLAKFIYTLRHSMWHIGELGRAIRDWDCERISWR
ncbi:MAG: hypothetical protein ACFFDD_10825 [Promethearchaeota archaeon]